MRVALRIRRPRRGRACEILPSRFLPTSAMFWDIFKTHPAPPLAPRTPPGLSKMGGVFPFWPPKIDLQKTMPKMSQMVPKWAPKGSPKYLKIPQHVFLEGSWDRSAKTCAKLSHSDPLQPRKLSWRLHGSLVLDVPLLLQKVSKMMPWRPHFNSFGNQKSLKRPSGEISKNVSNKVSQQVRNKYPKLPPKCTTFSSERGSV